MKKYLYAVMVAVFFVLLIHQTVTPAKCQEVSYGDYFGGTDYTYFRVSNPEIGQDVYIRVRGLPWWFDPLYLPAGWYLVAPFPTALILWDATCYGGSWVFGNLWIRDWRYDSLRGRILEMRSFWTNHFLEKYQIAHKAAMVRYTGNLHHAPAGFHERHGGIGKQGTDRVRNFERQRPPEKRVPSYPDKQIAPHPTGAGEPHPGNVRPLRDFNGTRRTVVPNTIRPPRAFNSPAPGQAPNIRDFRPGPDMQRAPMQNPQFQSHPQMMRPGQVPGMQRQTPAPQFRAPVQKVAPAKPAPQPTNRR